jgi:hypothetical protein
VDGLIWSNTIQPYVKSYAVYLCKDSALNVMFPSTPTAPASTTYSFNGDLQNYSLAGVDEPNVVTLAWAGYLGNAMIGYAASNPILTCNDPTQPCVYLPQNSNGCDGTTSNGNGGQDSLVVFGLSKTTCYVHATGDNIIYVDGHAKYVNYALNGGPDTTTPWYLQDSSGDILDSSGQYTYYFDGCHSYGMEPDFNPGF